MAPRNLQEILDATPAVELLRNSQVGAYVYPVVAAEFTNWRREQNAWRETAVLFDQSHHMVNFFSRGPDALKLISDTAINSVENFPSTSPSSTSRRADGNVIGDGILFHLDQDEFVSSAAPRRELAAVPRRDRRLRRRDREGRASPCAPTGKPVTRKDWRFQIQGPNAWPIIEKLNGGPVEEVKFFRMGEMNIAGEPVRTLRHGMAGAPGLEIWGPYETYDEVRDAILDAGAGVRSRAGRLARLFVQHARVGLDPVSAAGRSTRASSCARTASGCRATSYEAVNALAGSFVSDDIEDYYLNPWELGYGPFVKFDHDFIGREALEQIDPEAQRKKVTLAWNSEDLAEIFASMLRPGGRALPVLRPAERQLRLVQLRLRDRRRRHVVGLSLFTGYSANERRGALARDGRPGDRGRHRTEGRLG